MRRLARRPKRSAARLDPELAAEVEREPRWMYPWDLGAGVRVPLLAAELESIHRTRRELAEPPVRRRLVEAGPRARAIDLACNEGHFSQWLLGCGAADVVGIDIRDVHVRRAELLRRHAGIDAARLSFEQGDVFALDFERLGAFDVVLNLGLIYHVEDPIGAIRHSRRLLAPGGLCVVESQLTRQQDPIVHGWGATDAFEEADASFAARFEGDQDTNTLASAGGVVSLVPNRAALVLAMRAAGLEDVQVLAARPGHNPQYVKGDRAVAIGRAPR